MIVHKWAKSLAVGAVRDAAARMARTFIAKNRQVWLFGSWFGERYCDNPRHLFEFVASNRTDILPIWLARDRSVIQAVRDRGFRAAHVESRAASIWARNAEVVVSSMDGNHDLGTRATLGQVQVCLWHGMPMKKIGADAPKPWSLNPTPDLLTATSPTTQKVLMGAFRLSDDTVRVTGEPRTDVLFSSNHDLADLRRRLLSIGPEVKIVSYLPTHRDPETASGDAKGLMTAVDEMRRSETLASVLHARNAVIIVKGHFYQGCVPGGSGPARERIIVVPPSSTFDTNELLAITDVLVTDYSSCYFDFLLTGRPIVFYCYDLDSYVNDSRAFYYDYPSITAGVMAYSMTEVVDGVDKYLADAGADAQARSSARNVFQQYQAGSACARVVEEILRLVNDRRHPVRGSIVAEVLSACVHN